MWQGKRVSVILMTYAERGSIRATIEGFLATGLVETATDLQGVEEAHMTVEHVSLTDVPAMIADGRLTDAKTIIGLTLTRARLG